MLETRELSKSYGEKVALNQFSFSMKAGEIVGVVGPNGSGKTTLLNILTGMLSPTSGEYEIDIEVKVGMSMARKGFFSDMTTRNNLLLYSSLMEANKEKVEELMEYFEVDFQNVPFGKLSAGMRQKVSLIFAFIKDNDLIYLDEPSNHLDIDSIINLRTLITKLNQSVGTSFIITSHIFSDLEKVCDRILFLKNGKLYEDAMKVDLIDRFKSLENAYLKILSKNG